MRLAPTQDHEHFEYLTQYSPAYPTPTILLEALNCTSGPRISSLHYSPRSPRPSSTPAHQLTALVDFPLHHNQTNTELVVVPGPDPTTRIPSDTRSEPRLRLSFPHNLSLPVRLALACLLAEGTTHFLCFLLPAAAFTSRDRPTFFVADTHTLAGAFIFSVCIAIPSSSVARRTPSVWLRPVPLVGVAARTSWSPGNAVVRCRS